MRSRYYVGLLVVALLPLVIGSAAADPSIFGPTGLLRVPNADVTPPGSLQFSGHYATDLATTVNFSIGVIRRVELSGGYVDPDGGSPEAILNAKLRLFGEDERDFALAVGVFDATGEMNASLFGVAEQSLIVGETPVRILAGIGESNSMVDGLFFGAEAMLGRGYKLLLEYDGRDVNGAMRVPINSNLNATVGIVTGGLYASASYKIR